MRTSVDLSLRQFFRLCRLCQQSHFSDMVVPLAQVVYPRNFRIGKLVEVLFDVRALGAFLRKQRTKLTLWEAYFQGFCP